MRDLLVELMNTAARHADYADARFVRMRNERLSTRNGAPDQLMLEESEGIGVRVRVGGAWGFAAARGCERRDAEAALARALALAQAADRRRSAYPEPPERGVWESPLERNPFEVSLEDKLSVLAAADRAPGPAGREARHRTLRGVGTEKLFASSEGALCEQRITECGGGIAAEAADDAHSQIRSFPASHGGHVAQAGFEHFLALDLPGRAPRVAEEAAPRAPACPPGRSTLLLAGEQLGRRFTNRRARSSSPRARPRPLRRHELRGAWGRRPPAPARAASTSPPTPRPPAGWAPFADDEGVAGRALPIVREGVLRDFLSSRETAAEIGAERSGGCMRADGFARQPIVRMTNVNLEAGEAGTLDDLVADTDEGLLIDTNRSWSIDDRRLQFQFEGEAAWEIRAGERGRLLRNPSYAGVTPSFGRAATRSARGRRGRSSRCSIAARRARPVARVSHGSAPARFRGVEVELPDAPLLLAERALEQVSGDALASVTRERSLTMRFAANRPRRQPRSTTRSSSPWSGTVSWGAATNSERRRDRVVRPASRKRRRGGRARGERLVPRLSRARARPGAHGDDAETAALDPATGGTASPARSTSRARAHRGPRHLDQRRGRTGGGGCRRGGARTHDRRVHEGHRHRRRWSQRVRPGRGVGRAPGSRRAGRAPRARRPPASRPAALEPGLYGVVMEAQPSAACSTCSPTSPSTA